MARAEMGDDVHHFAVTLEHRGGVISSARTETIRAPWSTCAGAELTLARLAGKPLAFPLPFDPPQARYENCTHMLDLANLAAGRAGESNFERRYRFEAFLKGPRAAQATLWRDGEQELDWKIGKGIVVSDDEHNGRPLSDLSAWLGSQAIDAAEPISIMRRAIHIAGSRAVDLDAFRTAKEMGSLPATCHTLLPGIIEQAKRNTGTFVDFWAQDRWPLDID
jgi:hypothetical protein